MKKRRLAWLGKSAMLCLLMAGIYACGNESEEFPNEPQTPVNPEQQTEVIRTFSVSDITELQKGLDGTEHLQEYEGEAATRCFGVEVKALKVRTYTRHPHALKSNNVSHAGVLLVPQTDSNEAKKLIVVSPGSYTANDNTPTKVINSGLLKMLLSTNGLYVSMCINLAQKGYYVLVPDYLGFGESTKECIFPMGIKQPSVTSTIDLIKATRTTLYNEGYATENDIVLAGYSLGGYTTLALAKEIETAAHGLQTNLIVAGGAPCNLKDLAEGFRKSIVSTNAIVVNTFAWAYLENGYMSQKEVDNVLKAPYNTMSHVLDGYSFNELQNTLLPSKLFTSEYRKNGDEIFDSLLQNNSLETWETKTPVVMIHGIADMNVPNKNAQAFYKEQQKINASTTTLVSKYGEHASVAFAFFGELEKRLKMMK